VHETGIQKAVTLAAQKATIHKPVSVHTLWHSFGTHLLLNRVDMADSGIPRPRPRRDHDDHTHVVKELRNPARSPLDILRSRQTTD
jgi:hypothetical protein